MLVLRSLRVRLRLTAAFAVLALLIVAVAAVCLVGYDRSQRDTAVVADSLALTQDAMQAKFRTADMAGWQTGYAFDVNRGVTGAERDDVGQRAEFLASTSAFRDDLEAIAAYDLTPAETELLDVARTEFDAFTAVDARIIAGYRAGTPDAVLAANDLASGESLEHFGALADAVAELADSTRSRGEAAADRAMATTQAGERTMLAAATLGVVLAGLLAVVVTASITGPLRGLARRMDGIANGDGDLTVRLSEEGNDELTVVSRSFNRFVDSLQRLVREVAATVTTLTAASEGMAGTSTTLAGSAGLTSEQAGVAAAAASQVDASLQTVASGAEEMGASIREIAQGALEASRMTATAVRAADAASATVAQLGEASTEIDSVLTVIGGIAEQTNLLALNATIEAARAGEAGKGFAVVAHEVKELARESAQATESIRQRVDGIQEQSAAAVRAIDEILRVIAQVDGHATTIATAVEEQTAVTQEMSRSVTEAATGAGQIAANIAGVAEAAATTTDGVGSAQAVAGQIEQSAHDLRGLVAQFRV